MMKMDILQENKTIEKTIYLKRGGQNMWSLKVFSVEVTNVVFEGFFMKVSG